MTTYKKRDIDKRLAKLGAEPLYKKGRDYYTNYQGVPIPGIIVTHPGKEVPDISINKLARKIAEIKHSDPSFIKKVLTGREKIHSRIESLVSAAILILTGIFILFVLMQQNILTGFTIAKNISNTNLKISLLVCALGILGLSIYKILKNKKN